MKVRFPRTSAAVIFSLALSGCGPSISSLNSLAKSGNIDASAPVTAHVQIDIAAPPPRVWALLVDAPRWPEWEKTISHVSTVGPLSPGQRFTWGEGAQTVHSQVQLFQPEQRLGWTGTAYTAKAVHLWTLTPEADGHTLVTVNESMDGFLMARFFSSEELAHAASEWLSRLKIAAENERPSPSRL